MDDLTSGHSAGLDAPNTVLNELDVNTTAHTDDRQFAKDQNIEQVGVENAQDFGVHDGMNNPAQDDDDPSHSDLKAGLAPKKKRKKRKPKSQRGLGAPTGFEEYYVDAPVTPAEYEEEKDIYHQSRTFSERIETAIQRYKAKRNFDSERKDIFDKYMSFGGIDTGPKMFSGGLDANMLDEHSAQEIKDITATDFVGSDKADIGRDSSTWVVDFEGVIKGFLSSRLPQVLDYGEEGQLKSYIAVIRNFLNYLLHHDVCQEYNGQINSARAICDLAEKELWKVRKASWALPGDFNIACSTLFGGCYQGLYAGDQEWAKGMELTVGMSDQVAWRTFKFGIAALGYNQAERFADLAISSNNRIVKTKMTGLEVTKITYADEDTRQFYKDQEPGLRVLGKLYAKDWKCPTTAGEDLTDDEKARPPPELEEYEFWVEEAVLDVCFVGMKMEGTVRDLNCGVQFLDQVQAVYSSFFTFLPNERMIGWKDPVLISADGEGKGDDEGEPDTGENLLD